MAKERNKKLTGVWKEAFERSQKGKTSLVGRASGLDKNHPYHHVFNEELKRSLLQHQELNASASIDELGEIINSTELIALKVYREKIKNRLDKNEILQAIYNQQLEHIDEAKTIDSQEEQFWGVRIISLISDDLISVQEIKELISKLGGVHKPDYGKVIIPIMDVPKTLLDNIEEYMIQSEKMILDDSKQLWGR